MKCFLVIRFTDPRKTIRKWCGSYSVALSELQMISSDNVDSIVEVKLEFDR